MRYIAILLFISSALGAEPLLTEHQTIKSLYIKNNEVRLTNKLTSHSLSEELTKAAQDQAFYMASRHDSGKEDFNHRGDNGTPGSRASKYEYSGLIKENIARGFTTIEKVFEAWQDSQSHRDAILSDMVDVGFGYAVAKDGTSYWVVLYGKPKSSPDFLFSSASVSYK